MSKRLHLVAEEFEFTKLFGDLDQLPGLLVMPPRHNVAPTEPLVTITLEYGKRSARLMKWSFLPDWVKDPRDFSLLTSARIETVEKKPSFKNAIRYRRCLVPVTGFYEWQRLGASEESVPYFFRQQGNALFAIAGIWETWMGPNGEEFDGLAILTTPSVRRYKPITDRLPLIIPPEDFDAWLNVRSGRFDEARPLLKSPAPEELVAYAVSDRVNSRINDDASLTEPVIAHQDEAAKKLRPSEHEELPAKEENAASPLQQQLDLFKV